MVLSRARQELLDLVEYLFVLIEIALVECARELLQARSPYVGREIARMLDAGERIFGPMHDERGCRDRTQYLTGIDEQREAVGCTGHRRRRRASLKPSEMAAGSIVIRSI